MFVQFDSNRHNDPSWRGRVVIKFIHPLQSKQKAVPKKIPLHFSKNKFCFQTGNFHPDTVLLEMFATTLFH